MNATIGGRYRVTYRIGVHRRECVGDYLGTTGLGGVWSFRPYGGTTVILDEQVETIDEVSPLETAVVLPHPKQAS